MQNIFIGQEVLIKLTLWNNDDNATLIHHLTGLVVNIPVY